MPNGRRKKYLHGPLLELYCQGKYKIVGEEYVRLPLCRPQIQCGMPWDETLVCAWVMWVCVHVLNYRWSKHWIGHNKPGNSERIGWTLTEGKTVSRLRLSGMWRRVPPYTNVTLKKTTKLKDCCFISGSCKVSRFLRVNWRRSISAYYLIFVLSNISCVLMPTLYTWLNWDKLQIVDWDV
jgi:hypothetical protein